MGQTKAQRIIKQLAGKVQKQTPIASDMFLPNHSGIASHPEAIKAFGIWKLNGVKAYYNDGGIGIGTNNPTGLLHVYSTTSGVGPIMQSTAANSDVKMIFWNDAKYWSAGNFGTDSDKFKIVDTTTDRLVIDGSGNISGINITSGENPGHTHTGTSLSSIDISADTNLAAGTGITLTDDTLSSNDSAIVHDNLSGFVANEHIDHTGVTLTAGTNMTGGGTIAANRTFNVALTTGTNVTGDHGTAATDQVVNVCYGTGDPPAANTTTIGTLFIKYTA